ncbi:MAG: sensor histidine kinase [Saprospiraceae bacterium]|nr:sensor histidine kinase [Saprospiraceae bacterium]
MESGFQASEIIFLMSIGILIMVALAFAFVWYFNRAQKLILRQQMQNQQLELQYQQELLQKNILVQEEERRRIASDLHDEISSKLNVLHLNLHRLRKMEPQTPNYDQTVDDINSLISNTLDATRRISHELMPPTLEDFGLIEAVKELSQHVSQSEAAAIHFESEPTREEIGDATTELNLFRIIQELINNSLRHGKATSIDIQFLNRDPYIELYYRDNGKGFDVTQSGKKGLGLRNIESRVQIIGATFQVNSKPGEGFEFIMRTNKFTT